jgi:hypothetical protein
MSQHLGLTETEAFDRAINLAREEDVSVWAGAIAFVNNRSHNTGS